MYKILLSNISRHYLIEAPRGLLTSPGENPQSSQQWEGKNLSRKTPSPVYQAAMGMAAAGS